MTVVAEDSVALAAALDAEGWAEAGSQVLGRTLLIVRSRLPPPEARFGKEPWDWWRESEWLAVRDLAPADLRDVAMVREVFTVRRKVPTVLPPGSIPLDELTPAAELMEDFESIRVKAHRLSQRLKW